MRTWAFLLGGMAVWTVHFFGSYGIASILPERILLAKLLSGGLTLACLAALASLTRRSWTAVSRERDTVSDWIALMASMLNAIALVAVFWQGFPALLA